MNARDCAAQALVVALFAVPHAFASSVTACQQNVAISPDAGVADARARLESHPADARCALDLSAWRSMATSADSVWSVGHAAKWSVTMLPGAVRLSREQAKASPIPAGSKLLLIGDALDPQPTERLCQEIRRQRSSDDVYVLVGGARAWRATLQSATEALLAAEIDVDAAAAWFEDGDTQWVDYAQTSADALNRVAPHARRILVVPPALSVGEIEQSMRRLDPHTWWVRATPNELSLAANRLEAVASGRNRRLTKPCGTQ